MHSRPAAQRAHDWKWWGFPVAVMVMLQGTGPCYDDDCSNPGEGWCNGQTATSCEGAGMNQAYWLSHQDCAAQGLTCVAGQGQGYRGDETKLSWCLDIRSCDVVGAYECSSSPLDGTPVLMRCANISSTRWYQENGVVRFLNPTSIQRVLEPLSEMGYGSSAEEVVNVPCVACASTCGCGTGLVCRDGWCIPEEVVGVSDDDLVCCGRERGDDCPKGAACQNLDGSEGLCETAARCEACSTSLECESSDLACLATGPEQSSVCLAPNEADQFTYGCRPESNEAWKQDVCGTWVELAATVAVAYACKEGTDQSWSMNACDQWIAMAGDCGAGYRCEANNCIKRVPEIEISPSLLDFGPVQVGASKTLTVSVGNVGFWPLQVTELLVQSASADSFMLSETSLQVGVDEIVSVELTFSPTQAGGVQAKLLVQSDDSDEPEKSVLINGTGTL